MSDGGLHAKTAIKHLEALYAATGHPAFKRAVAWTRRAQDILQPYTNESHHWIEPLVAWDNDLGVATLDWWNHECSLTVYLGELVCEYTRIWGTGVEDIEAGGESIVDGGACHDAETMEQLMAWIHEAA